MESEPATETRITALMLVCLIAGVALGIAAMTIIFPLAPTELSRTGVLLHALRERNDVPPLVVLGDSVTMNGIDARLLGDGRAAWNCASVGQEPAESLLVADVLPPSVRTIVIGITVEKLVVSNTSIPPNKYVGYVMSGYSPSPSVRAVARQLPDGKLDALLRTSRIRVVIWSRWVVRALADLIARRALRPNLDLERARVDLYHPAPYTRAVSAAALDHLIAINFNSWRGHFAPTSGVMTVLKGIRDLAAARGQRVVFVIMPEHPARRPRSSAQFYMELAQWVNRSRSESFEIIDLHDSLGADGFFDNVHPGGNGTVQLTRRLDAELKRGRN